MHRNGISEEGRSEELVADADKSEHWMLKQLCGSGCNIWYCWS